MYVVFPKHLAIQICDAMLSITVQVIHWNCHLCVLAQWVLYKWTAWLVCGNNASFPCFLPPHGLQQILNLWNWLTHFITLRATSLFHGYLSLQSLILCSVVNSFSDSSSFWHHLTYMKACQHEIFALFYRLMPFGTVCWHDTIFK